jgi:hypothetical protein
VLRDAAKLQEEDARYANRKGYSKHHPALPLFTERDARAALRQFRAVDHDHWFDVAGYSVCRNAGHIWVRVCGGGGARAGVKTTIVKGDVSGTARRCTRTRPASGVRHAGSESTHKIDS